MDRFITQAVQETNKPNKLKSSLFSSNFISQSNYPEEGITDSNVESLLDNHPLLDGSSLIHLNIKGSHYYITRDQLMSLPESILLYMFPHGVFLDEEGDVIMNLSPDSEVYISQFSPGCFEYIMSVFFKAYDNYTNFPFHQYYNISKSNGNNSLSLLAKGFFGLNSGSTALVSTGASSHLQKETEKDILHEKPTIIVLKEDLDYYCVPKVDIKFEGDIPLKLQNNLLDETMHAIKEAAGKYLLADNEIFKGLVNSNRIKYKERFETNSKSSKNHKSHKTSSSKKNDSKDVEKHLMDMLISSGLKKDAQWGNRTADELKTVIESLTLIRLYNETTDEFREEYEKRKKQWQIDYAKKLEEMQLNSKNMQYSNSSSNRNFNLPNRAGRPQLTTSMSQNAIVTAPTKKSSQKASHLNNSIPLSFSTSNIKSLSNSEDSTVPDSVANSSLIDDNDLIPPVSSATNTSMATSSGRKSRFSRFTDSMRSRSTSRNPSKTRQDHTINPSPETPYIYEIIDKPEINYKLLLFWKKPARKCWWSEIEIELQIEVPGEITKIDHKTTLLLQDPRTLPHKNTISIPIKLHLRRVWTLELSIIGANDQQLHL